MSALNILKVAGRSLSRNKMRTTLTMLGIIIGVAAVIAMLGIGQGARDAVQNQIANLGTNVLIIFPDAARTGGVRAEAGTGEQMTEADADFIRQEAPSIAHISPTVRSNEQVATEGQNWRTSIYGVYPEYLLIRNWGVESGSAFSMSENRTAAKVALIGKTVSTNLFGQGVDPVGQTVRIRNLPFRVIGVLESKGQSGVGQDQDDMVLAPFATVQKKLLGITNAQTLYASAVSTERMDLAMEEIRQILRERHRLHPEEDDDFNIRSQSEIASAAGNTFQILSILLASIASVSLLVGGIGIMNIMLVSVTERTREIGLRMAVGARGADVLIQFLVEAILLSFAGGVIGAILGVGVCKFIENVQHWAITIQPQAILLAFLFTSFVGIFFGWYPARKASRLNPIEALRFE